MNFDSFAFDKRIHAGIDSFGYTEPTPIQARGIPAVLAGRDVLGLAQTGTGKTAAFVLPISQTLLDARVSRKGPVRVLVLAPTRELALQTHECFEAFGKHTGIRSAVVYGGVGIASQARALRRATVVVACPGRLLDLHNRHLIDLNHVGALVIDEADRMFDMGFMPDLRKIMALLPRKRQNLLFSATMPDEVGRLCSSLLRDRAVIQVANNTPVATVRQALYHVPAHLKAPFLEALLREIKHDNVLVFTRTKHKAKSLAQKLIRQGWKATSLQGNLSQSKRQEALSGFRNGKYRIMLATDIASRGLDCERISHVINFDVPDTVEGYTHRIGRTARAGKSGAAITLVSDEDKGQVRSIECALKCKIDRLHLGGFDYKAAKKPDGRPRDFATGNGGRPRAGKPGNKAGGKPGSRKHSASPAKRGKGSELH